VQVAPACAGSGEGSDHFGSIVRSLSLHYCKRLFPGLEPVTSWSQCSSFTTALPLSHSNKLKPPWLSQDKCLQQGFMTLIKQQGKKKIHNRRSNQDTYHVTNKNICSSKIPMVIGTKRGCHSGASPSLDA
jgi:hypothetical protein